MTEPRAARPSTADRPGRGTTALFAICATVLGSMLGASAFAIHLIRVRADRAAVVLLVEDMVPGSRRADSVVVATWDRQCAEIDVTIVPRDAVVRPGGEPLATALETLGPTDLGRAVGELLDIRVAAVVTLDLVDVARVSEAIGPVTVEIERETADHRAGFHGRPGMLQLIGDDAVAFLRSRAWEEWDGNEWVGVGRSDLQRVDHVGTFVSAAGKRVASLSGVQVARVAATAVRAADIDVVDPWAAAGIAWGAARADDVDVDVIEVAPERSDDHRSSPFAPHHHGALDRLVAIDPSALHARRGRCAPHVDANGLSNASHATPSDAEAPA
jgi:LCP family protein required for cell wall assembly